MQTTTNIHRAVTALTTLLNNTKYHNSVNEIGYKYETFSECLDRIIRDKYDAITRDVIHLIFDRYGKVLSFARKNKLSIANYYLTETDPYTDMLDSSCKNIILSYTYPIKAYYHYKLGDYKGAIDLLNKAFSIDEELEKDSFYILVMHRVQTLHNLCRIYFKQKDERGNFLSLSLLDFLVDNNNLLFGNYFIDRNSAKNINWGLRTDMYFQIMNELVVQILYHPNYKKEVLSCIKKGLQSDTANKLQKKEWILKWIEINEISDKGETLLYYSKFLDFLNLNIKQLNILKLQTLLQLYIDVKDILDENMRENLKKDVINYINNGSIIQNAVTKKVTELIDLYDSRISA